MIDNERTLEIYGYKVEDLSPVSNRKVVAICDDCGVIREPKFCDYRELCVRCVKKTTTFIERASAAHTGVKQTEEHKKKKADAIRGEKHWNWKGGEILLVCQWCGNTYTKRSDHVKTSRFCSVLCKAEYQSKYDIGECAANWQGGGVDVRCIQCGKSFKVNKYAAKTTKFCSKKCHYEYKTEHDKGKNNPNWRGGISNEGYSHLFNFGFKEKIRNRYDRKCYLCTKPESKNGRRLDIHHVSYEKGALCDGVKYDFVPLCTRCHGKTSYNRFFWEALLTYALQYEDEYYADIAHNPLILLAL